MLIPNPTRRPFEKANWTPRALRVLATAKAFASPRPITPHHLVLAFEAGDTVASRVLKSLGTLPSVGLGRAAPAALLEDGELYIEDFDVEFRRVMPLLAIEEAKRLGYVFFGTECLLLMLARIGVSGVELPYDRIRQAIIEAITPHGAP